jgi:hypothetical protein
MLITDWVGLIVSLLLPHIVPDHKPPGSDPLRTRSEKRLLNVLELGRVAEPMRPHPADAAGQVAYRPPCAFVFAWRCCSRERRSRLGDESGKNPRHTAAAAALLFDVAATVRGLSVSMLSARPSRHDALRRSGTTLSPTGPTHPRDLPQDPERSALAAMKGDREPRNDTAVTISGSAAAKRAYSLIGVGP